VKFYLKIFFSKKANLILSASQGEILPKLKILAPGIFEEKGEFRLFSGW
jgi:hypothetical protein